MSMHLRGAVAARLRSARRPSEASARRLPAVALALSLAVSACCISACGDLDPTSIPGAAATNPERAMGVCPPFTLKDEHGAVIDPVHGINDTEPYSPRQTCGATGCHDYAKITEGFHFTQGKGESVPSVMAARYNWVTSPGNYGGNWCSPSPLYRQLAPKHNTNARMIDMTSFDFVTATCGNCHPGGGPLEFDREGRRYDVRMRDAASGLVPGGDNGLDGDYYKARWSETGVIEADCMLCHMPEYNVKIRNDALADLNFRWAATAGAGFGTVAGSVKRGDRPVVSYDASRFDSAGNALVHIAPEPRNETCLQCHFKPDWKKRGAAYSARTDVHMVAGMRCVDCHSAGSRAADPRIRGRELHQVGKGDDPSGWVRNDLDNTVRGCASCHTDGWRNAPRATHDWLPPTHLETLSCEACHIPVRAVKSALVQASDVFNPAPRITPPPKHIWTFYDQSMAFWNHYGELDLFTGKDEPTTISRPTLIRYKGKIYPANRVHSAWVGYEESGKPGLNQLFMKDFFQMWTKHRADPARAAPELARIRDDNGDGVAEVNSPEEIDALLAAVRAYLPTTGFSLDTRRLVWVSDDRAYYSSKEHRVLAREEHEATPYASVYKYSHDVAPARAALGAGGCTDCHSSASPFFRGAVLETAFDAATAQPRWMPNHVILGSSAASVRLGAFREEILKPFVYLLMGLYLLLLAALGLRMLLQSAVGFTPRRARRWAWAGVALGILVCAFLLYEPVWLHYIIVRRFTLDANHAWLSLAAFVMAGGALLRHRAAARGESAFRSMCAQVVLAGLLLSAISAVFMILSVDPIWSLTRYAYTTIELGLAIGLLGACCMHVEHLWPRQEAPKGGTRSHSMVEVP